MNKFLVSLVLSLSLSPVFSQIGNEAWDNYSNSNYESISNEEESDATIIFDRTYLQTKKVIDKVELITTIHRKIKINSLYGLQQFNRLYIPTYSDLHFNIEFVDCKAKTLKEGKETVITDTSQFVTGTLPANTPFFYKVDGNVKMLALNDINIGDEIEYVYSLKHTYDINPINYYNNDRFYFSSSNYCLEKSIYFDTEGFKVKLWPHNFNNDKNRNSDFTYGKGKLVRLNNVKERSDELYNNSYLTEPFLNYIISVDNALKEDTWKGFAKDFRPSRKETKKNYIFNGESTLETLRSVGKVSGLKNKYQAILDRINQPLQEHFSQYEEVKDDIDAAWSYAKILSKTLKSMKMPINIHFVVSKHYGKLDKTYVTLYQFDNIITSFVDETGTTFYMPLLEPYSNFNDIRQEFQGTECFTIMQDETGKRTHSFGAIPFFNSKENSYMKEVNLLLTEEKIDTVKFSIKEKLSFIGDSWLEIKPFITHILNDSSRTKDNLEIFIKRQLVLSKKVDSIYQVTHKIKDNSFTIDYKYDVSLEKQKHSTILKLNPSDFIDNEYYTPFHLRNKRDKRGYLFGEFNTKYSLTFNLGDNYQWIENKLTTQKQANSIGEFESTYAIEGNQIITNFKLNYNTDQFEADNWNEVLDLRDLSYNFLNANFYFKKK